MASWIVAYNVFSPLGFTARENYAAIQAGKIAIKKNEMGQSVSVIPQNSLPSFLFEKKTSFGFTYFEELLIRSVKDALSFSSVDPTSGRVVFILSTTKGNINLLENEHRKEQLLLNYSATVVGDYFKNPNNPIVVSNACISGIMAMLVAKRLLSSGKYDHAVVMGADIVSEFVLAGFQSLSAMSPTSCKPFDLDRTGISLGEAAATVIVSKDRKAGEISNIEITGGGLSNDANHISGPSKTGEELASAINQALNESKLTAHEIDFVSAHGTATLFNDEMEAKAFDHAGLIDKPVNSLKGSFGHTLGAAGIVESVMNIEGMLQNEVLPTVGFEKMGVSKPLNVSSKIKKLESKICLKTGSGFGGCNAAIIFQKRNG